MQVQVTKTTLQEINHFRIVFLHENHFQLLTISALLWLGGYLSIFAW